MATSVHPKLQTLGLRENTTASAHIVSAAQPIFKIAAIVGAAGLTVGTGGFPCLVMAGLGAGAMLGNVLKKKFNPNENSEFEKQIIEEAMKIPAVQATITYIFKDKHYEKRFDDVVNGNLDQYSAISPEVKKFARSLRLYGLVACGMICSQVGVDDPRDVLKAIKELAEDYEGIELGGDLIQIEKDAQAILDDLQANPDFIEMVELLKNHNPLADFSMDNIKHGLMIEDSEILKKYKELEPQIEKFNEFLKMASDTDTAVQETMGTTINGKSTLSAYTKNKNYGQKIITAETLAHRVFDFPNKVKEEAILTFVRKAREFLQGDSEQHEMKGPKQ